MEGCRPPKIAELLRGESIVVSRRGVAKFLLRVIATGLTARRTGSGRPTKLTADVKDVIERHRKQMARFVPRPYIIHLLAVRIPLF